jgi:type IV pilus assembly protein PilB
MESQSKEENILKLMNIKKIKSIDLSSIDLNISKEIIDKNVLFTTSKNIIVKDPLNMNIHILKQKLKFKEIFLLNEVIFDSIIEDILKTEDRKIEGVNLNEEESNTLDNTEISKLLYQIFYSAKLKSASDIHIVPKKEFTLVSLRIDGKMQEYNKYPASYCPVIVNKIKSESGLDQFNMHTPQDGKLKTEIDGSNMEFRVSTLPTIYGENTVMRVVNTENLFNITLNDLGFEEEDLEKYRRNYMEPYGMIINVGATGQGKTTTFYLTLNELFNIFPHKNICTVEDPVEIRFEKALQVQVNDTVGRTFPVVLKSLLRQDPDIILIGEMRDSETAEIGVRSALTGHLVFTTLHATDSFNAVTRLRDLDISDTLLSSTLSCILSQRLSRKLCSCKEKTSIPKNILDKYGLDFNEFYIPKGCQKCDNSGYKGRTAVIEVWEIDEDYKNAIAFNEGEVKIKMLAKEKNFQNLWKNGLKKVKRGDISLEELEVIVKPDKIINSLN